MAVASRQEHAPTTCNHGAHGHDHAAKSHAPKISFSLLRLSALQRSVGVGFPAALIWLGVWWAQH